MEHWEICRLLSEIKVSWFHVPHFNVPLLPAGKTKIGATIHDIALDLFPEEIKSWLHRIYYKRSMKKAMRADRIITDSEYSKATIQKIYGGRKIELVYCGFEPRQTNLKGVVRNRNQFLYVGVNQHRKNLKFLVDVFESLPSEITLTVVGRMKGAPYDIIADVKKRGLNDRIKILGYISDAELHDLYSSSTALLFPSLLEGFGYPILEAANYKLPVICSNISSLPEVGGDGCLYFDPYSREDCKSKILQLRDDEKLMITLINNNLKRITLFEPQTFFNRLIAPYLVNGV
jgi:glycosyltransferase involved in cell wall biosynthesis